MGGRRNLLHRTRLVEFVAWCVREGWRLQPARSEWEAARLERNGEIAIVYDRASGDHFTTEGRALRLAKDFIHQKRKP